MSLIKRLQKNTRAALPMHMPGHKRNTSLSPYLKRLSADLDITEITGFDNLHSPDGILKDGMDKTAKLFKAKKSFWLVNGSTAGILSAVDALLSKGDAVICARNCHRSVYNALSLKEANPSFLMPDSLGRISKDSVKTAIKATPDCKLVIITSPDYYGVLSDIEGICEISHKYNIPVLVDEAHGAHLGFSDYFPKNAINCGADVVVQSLHKTLLGLTGTALLHINSDRPNINKIKSSLSVFQTSSPSYLLMASIDECVNLLKNKGGMLFKRFEQNLRFFYDNISSLKNLSVRLPSAHFDPSKIVVSTKKTNITGAALFNILRDTYKIEAEMCDLNNVVLMTGLGDTRKSLAKLKKSLFKIDKTLYASKKSTSAAEILLPQRSLSIHIAQILENHLIPLKDSVGCISSEYVWCYPPGIPLITPGEVISREKAEEFGILSESGINLKSESNALPEKIRVIK